MKYFTADSHYNHAGILLKKDFYGSNSGFRDFEDIRTMNQYMIDSWNEVVKAGDLVYHLGDFAMRNKGDGMGVAEIVKQLNGQIILIKGNHDDKNIKLFKGLFPKIVDLEYVRLSTGQRVMLCHYPMLSWRASIHGSLHLHGHCYGNLPKRKNCYDIGVDNCGFKPVPETIIPYLCVATNEEK